jgi:hypothetical protein
LLWPIRRSWRSDAHNVTSGKHAGHQHSPDRDQQAHRALPSYDEMVTRKYAFAKCEDRLGFTFELEQRALLGKAAAAPPWSRRLARRRATL